MGVEISGLDDFEKMLAEAEKRQRGAVNTFLKVEAEELLGAARHGGGRECCGLCRSR